MAGTVPNKSPTSALAAIAMIAAGVHKALCVIHEEQNQALVDRCAGFAKAMAATGGSVTVLHVNGAQLNSAANAIQAALKKDPAITGVLTTGIIGFNAAGGALQSLGKFGTIKLGTFDVSTQDLNAVVNGQALFVIDQQPFLEGYMAVQVSAFEARYSQHPFGPIFTGPSLITKANAAIPAMSLPYLNFCILFVVNRSLAPCVQTECISGDSVGCFSACCLSGRMPLRLRSRR